MPGGDGTGPMCFGPFTGRGAGYAGFPAPVMPTRSWGEAGSTRLGSRGQGIAQVVAPMAWPYGGYMPYGPAGMTPSQEAHFAQSDAGPQAQLEE